MKMNDFPCKDCFRRSITCHSTCEEYLEAKRKLEVIRKLEAEECSAKKQSKERKYRIDKKPHVNIWKSPKR